MSRDNLADPSGPDGATPPDSQFPEPHATATGEPAGSSRDSCGFCHGKPVGNAAKWIGGAGPDVLPCPRCGKVNR